MALPSGFKARINHFLITDLLEVGEQVVFCRARAAGTFTDCSLSAVCVGETGIPYDVMRQRLSTWHAVFAAPRYHGQVNPLIPLRIEPILLGQVECAAGVRLLDFAERDYILVFAGDDVRQLADRPEAAPPAAIEPRVCLERLQRVVHFLDFARAHKLEYPGPVRRGVVLGAERIVLHHPAFLPLFRIGPDGVAVAENVAVTGITEGDRSVAVAACLIDAAAPGAAMLPQTAAAVRQRCSGLTAAQCALLHEVLSAGSAGTRTCAELVHRLLYLDVCGRIAEPKPSAWWRRRVAAPLWLPALGTAAGLAVFLSVSALLLRMLG